MNPENPRPNVPLTLDESVGNRATLPSEANKKISRGVVVILVLVAVLATGIVSGVIGFTAGYVVGSAELDTPTSTAGDSSVGEDEEPEPAQPVYEPEPDDFEVGTSVKEQQCFGTAGCNVTLKIIPEYVGSQIPDESTTWEITYEIRGIEDSPLIDTFSLEDGEFSFQGEQSVSTSRKNAKITTKVTSVSQGY